MNAVISPLDVLRHTPLWVWGLLTALTVLGLHRLRPRQMPRWRVLLAPVIFLLLGLAAGTRSHQALLSWGVALAAGAALGGALLPVRPGVRFDATRSLLYVPGSIAPLCFMLSLFVLNYLIAVSLAIHLLQIDSPAALLLAGLTGLLSGVFLGRSLKLFLAAKTQLPEAV